MARKASRVSRHDQGARGFLEPEVVSKLRNMELRSLED